MALVEKDLSMRYQVWYSFKVHLQVTNVWCWESFLQLLTVKILEPGELAVTISSEGFKWMLTQRYIITILQCLERRKTDGTPCRRPKVPASK